jgi:hypothetical protein
MPEKQRERTTMKNFRRLFFLKAANLGDKNAIKKLSK